MVPSCVNGALVQNPATQLLVMLESEFFKCNTMYTYCMSSHFLVIRTYAEIRILHFPSDEILAFKIRTNSKFMPKFNAMAQSVVIDVAMRTII